jgi:aldose 1-epimerase
LLSRRFCSRFLPPWPYTYLYYAAKGAQNMQDSTAIPLENAHIRLGLLPKGAAMDTLYVPDRDGVWGDVLLGFANARDRAAFTAGQGETIGRYANRIAQGKFSLGGTLYTLTRNAGDLCLHGGGEFAAADWEIMEHTGTHARLRYVSPAGSHGFPGTVEAYADYTLHDNALEIRYTAMSDAETVLNLTNHAYFNLNGHGDILDHVLCIHADSYLPIDEKSIPIGQVRPVSGTVFDFRAPKPIGRDIAADPQVLATKGYDHNYCLARGRKAVTDTPDATVYAPQTGRWLGLFTDQPGLQLYTGNFLDAPGKTQPQTRHAGLCLETQIWPDAPNQKGFPPCVLRPGECYSAFTKFVFRAI